LLQSLSGLIEHEYLHVYRGRFVGEPRPNADEVGAWRWMGLPAIRRAMMRRPTTFTPWFGLLMGRVFGD
jgi:isopentenyl-diphosphate delta-isomerase